MNEMFTLYPSFMPLNLFILPTDGCNYIFHTRYYFVSILPNPEESLYDHYILYAHDEFMCI